MRMSKPEHITIHIYEQRWKRKQELNLNLAISLNGPPIPQPTSKTYSKQVQQTSGYCVFHYHVMLQQEQLKKGNHSAIGYSIFIRKLTFIPGFNSSCKARKCSCRLMLSLKDSPFHLKCQERWGITVSNVLLNLFI